MISNANVSIMVGLMVRVDTETPGAVLAPIDVTANTPNAISYGNDGNQHVVQSFLSSATDSVFMQPSSEPVDLYGSGLAIPAGRQDQFFLKPETGSAASGIGLIDPSDYIANQLGDPTFVNRYGPAYFLNVQYALYLNQVPEQLG